MKDIDIDEIYDLRDEMDDMVWESNQITDMLNRDYAVEVDDDELDAELRELDDGMFEEMMDQGAKKKESNVAPQQMANTNQYRGYWYV